MVTMNIKKKHAQEISDYRKSKKETNN